MGTRTRTIFRVAGAVFGSALLAAPLASADEVVLRGGGRVSGVIVERTGEVVVIETGPGRVSVAMSRVERIVEGRSALQAFQERASSLAPGDVAGWAALARWAAERELVTPSREAWQRVLAADPSHPEANAALGRVQLGGAWVSAEEGYRARGYVPFEGRWVSPAEHEALVRERQADEASDMARREADLRVREAEARAREAEARAREAEAPAPAEGDGGIPLWWGGGGVITRPPIGRGPHEPGAPHHPRAHPTPVFHPTPSSTPTSSVGPTGPPPRSTHQGGVSAPRP